MCSLVLTELDPFRGFARCDAPDAAGLLGYVGKKIENALLTYMKL